MTPPLPVHGPSDAPGDPRSDAELFAAVAAGDEDESAPGQQFLYQGHVRYLCGVLQRQRTRLLRIAGLGVDDLVQDTFQRAFVRAKGFSGEADLDPERARRRTRAWLGRIAQNLVTDSLRRYREVSASHYLDQIAVPARDEEPPSSRPELRPVRSALEQLSDREQDILRVSALYFKAEGGQVAQRRVRGWAGAGGSATTVRAIRSVRSSCARRSWQRVEPRRRRGGGGRGDELMSDDSHDQDDEQEADSSWDCSPTLTEDGG